MSFRSQNRRKWFHAAAAALGAAALVSAAQEARAEGPVSGTGKGIVGGALLGAEIVNIPIAIAGVDRAWPYIVFGVAGAAGGGVGGYFIEQEAPAEAPVYMLAGGMALVIPTIVAVLNATSYKPAEIERTEAPNQPVADPPSASATLKTTSAPRRDEGRRGAAARRPYVPQSLFDVHEGRLALGFPAVEVRPTYSELEIATYGVEQQPQLHFPVVSARF